MTLEFWVMWGTLSLSSLPDTLWIGLVALDRVVTMGQIEINCIYGKLKCLGRDCFDFKLHTYMLTELLGKELLLTSQVDDDIFMFGCSVCRYTMPIFIRMACFYISFNNSMVRFQWCWSFEEWGVPFHCHHSQTHPKLQVEFIKTYLGGY